MKKNILVICLYTMAFLCIEAQQHPRLFFSSSDIIALRNKAEVEPFKSMVAQMRYRYYWYNSSGDDYAQSICAALAGFLYLLTDSDYYAQTAKTKVSIRINDATDTTGWAKTTIKGLTSYWHGNYVSWAYDWCYNAPSWDASFKSTVSTKLWQMAQMIIDNGGTEQNTNTASNWQGIRGAAGGMCLLATDYNYNQTYMAKTIEKVDRYINDNYGDPYTSRGWNIEGLGYTYYPLGNFIGPFGIAIARVMPTFDLRKYAGMRNTYWSIYASLSKAMNLNGYGGLHPDWGDDNPYVSGQGTYGQSFYYLHDSLLPAAKYWYDRVMATRPDYPYDDNRSGIIWSFLYYPHDLPELDPMQLRMWKSFFIDKGGNGYMTYVNKYNDSRDMTAQVYLKLRGNKGHSGPDALNFRIVGEGAPWAIGGGRYGVKLNGIDVYKMNMNNLYYTNPESIHKDSINGNSGIIIGQPLSLPDGSGHCVMYIQKNNMMVDNQTRWFVADYDSTATGAIATYIIGDISDDGYYWQLNSYVKHNITTSSNTFTIQALDGSTMKGTILYPTSNYRYTVGARPRGSSYGTGIDSNRYMHFRSDDGDYLVVLTVAKNGVTHPVVSASGSGVINRSIQVGNKSYMLKDSTVLYNDIKIPGKPYASFVSSKLAGPSPLSLSFDASASVDPNGSELSYAWDFGDGNSATGMIVSHTYTAEGNYKPKLTVTNTIGQSDILTSFIAVHNTSLFNNMAPVAYLLYPANGSVHTAHSNILIGIWTNDFDGYISKVEYYANNIIIGTDSIYPFLFTWANVPSGSYTLKIMAYDNLGVSTTSATRTITINPAVEIPVLTAQAEIVSELIVYPNPAQSLITVKTGFDNGCRLEIINSTGQRMMQMLISGTQERVDISNLPVGMYIIKAEKEGRTVTQRIIKISNNR